MFQHWKYQHAAIIPAQGLRLIHSTIYQGRHFCVFLLCSFFWLEALCVKLPQDSFICSFHCQAIVFTQARTCSIASAASVVPNRFHHKTSKFRTAEPSRACNQFPNMFLLKRTRNNNDTFNHTVDIFQNKTSNTNKDTLYIHSIKSLHNSAWAQGLDSVRFSSENLRCLTCHPITPMT